MDDCVSSDLLRPFDKLPDPRAHNTVHPFGNILLIAIMAVLCGADDWQNVSRWGKAKAKWLSTFMNLSTGVPSRDTFRRVFALIDPDAFEQCFIAWAAQLVRVTEGRLVAVDGKTIRRSFARASGKGAMHLVSAFCERNHLVLGQLAVTDKSNEITAIPRLLQLLSLKDATVSIDAMGCQKTIAQTIVDEEGDYLLAVKDNHKTLHEDIRFFFEDAIAQGDEQLVTLDAPQVDGDHGRLETRQVWATSNVTWLKQRGHDWANLAGIVCVQSQRQTFGPEGKTSIERRYYITSHAPRKVGAARLLAMSRGHWAVENNLHWSLDVSFAEDQRRLRTGHGAENFSRLCRLALNLLKAEKTPRLSINSKRLQCGWDNDYLLKVLMNLG